jgi:hypothetical protein
MIGIRLTSKPSPESGYAIFFRDHAPKILILVTLLAIWMFGASSYFVPCVQDCGETFVAAHAVTNDRLYGMKYGQLHDSATIPDPERHPFLYSHNINLGSLVYVFLDRVGLTSLWEKQLVTLLAFGAGLYYVFLTVRHVTRSYVAALVVLFLFCTEYAQVLAFGLNALRAWHWLAFFGLIYHVLQYVSAEKKSCAADLFGITLFIAIAMAVGYEFLAIIGLITFFVTILCSKSWGRALTCVPWLLGSVALIFGLRQLQVISVLGLDFWSLDFLYSASIKLTALSKIFTIPSLAEVDAFYQARGILRPYSANVPFDTILPGLKRWVSEVTFPSAGFGSAASFVLVTLLSAGMLGFRAMQRLFSHRLVPQSKSIDVFATSQFMLALVLGTTAGLFLFASIAISIYLKHQFPLTAALLLIPKGVLIAACIHFIAARRQHLFATAAAFALAMVLVADHIATQIQNRATIPSMSVGWIPEVSKRQEATFAVSWIPSSIAGFTRNWVAGIQPGRESAILERISHGQPPFTESDLLEVNLANRDEIEKYQLLRPDYWLYFTTDQKLEVQSVAPSCNRAYARRLWDDLTSARNAPRLASINFDAPAGAGTFAGELTVTGRAIAFVEIRYGEILLARVGLDCDLGKFSGTLVSVDFPFDTIPVKVDAVSHSGERYRLGESMISLRMQRAARSSSQPRRQPSAADLSRINRTLPIAAEGVDFVLFDLRPLWKR